MVWLVYDVDTGNLKMAENFYLVRACEDKSLEDLVQYVSFRRIRARLSGCDAMEREAALESELGILEFGRLMGMFSDGREAFMAEVAGHLKELRNAENLLDFEKMARSVGAVLCFSLKNIGIDFPDVMPDGKRVHDFIPAKKCAIEEMLSQR